jgi:hypothetical protein
MADLNLDTERTAFEEWAELTASQTEGTAHDIAGWYYFDELTEDRWQAWKARARRTAPVSAPIVEELPPRPAVQLNGIGFYSAKQIGELVAPYAERIRELQAAYDAAVSLAGETIDARNAEVAEQVERIRQLEREKKEAYATGYDDGHIAGREKGRIAGKRELAERKTVSIDTPAFANLVSSYLNCRCNYSDLVAYIDGRTAGTAPEGWQMVPIEPAEEMVTCGFESWPDPFFSKAEEWEEYERMTGCQKAAHRARLCWAAMLAATPTLVRRLKNSSTSASEDNKYDCPGDARFSDAAPAPKNSGKEEA